MLFSGNLHFLGIILTKSTFLADVKQSECREYRCENVFSYWLTSFPFSAIIIKCQSIHPAINFSSCLLIIKASMLLCENIFISLATGTCRSLEFSLCLCLSKRRRKKVWKNKSQESWSPFFCVRPREVAFSTSWLSSRKWSHLCRCMLMLWDFIAKKNYSNWPECIKERPAFTIH